MHTVPAAAWAGRVMHRLAAGSCTGLSARDCPPELPWAAAACTGWLTTPSCTGLNALCPRPQVATHIEEGVKQLVRAEKHQKNSRIILCIMLLVAAVILLLVILIAKNLLF